MIELDIHETNGAKIRVIGVGGCGGNAIDNMIEKSLTGVSFISANTDKQVLDKNHAQLKLQLGKETTKGLGAGGDPEIGRLSAEENIDEIKESLLNSDMIFVTAGMGGGTGTGAAPVIARVAKELDALVVAVVTQPFSWEGRRFKIAEKGINELKEYVDALITIPNQKLLDITDKKVTFKQAYLTADEVLFNATRGISDIITKPGLVNVDFADVRSVMKGMGDALMGIGTASGENRAVEATHNALNSPLLDSISIAGAQGVLVNITGCVDNTTLHEVAEAVAMIEQSAGPDVNLIHGVVLVDEPMEELIVTVVATGFNNKQAKPKTGKTAFNFASPEVGLFKDKSKINNFVKIDSKPVAESEQAESPTAESLTPRGNKNFKEMDIPAFVRRMEADTRLDNISTVNNELKHFKTAEVDVEDNGSKNYDQPAFLRRMMD